MKDKRTQLIEATIDLFSKEGFWNTSTARISKHAGVATGRSSTISNPRKS